MSLKPQFKTQPAKLTVKRDGLPNVLAKLQAGGEVRVAFLGGSITAQEGWRVQTLQRLRAAYPQATIKEINAAIGGTGSDLGVMRYQRDVLRHKPDLVFVEFAVNDGLATPERIWQQLEGIIRQTWGANPSTDICYVYTLYALAGGYEKPLRRGLNPWQASADDMLAAYYGIPSINVALRTVQLAEAGKLLYVPKKGRNGQPRPLPPGVILWSEDMVHPLPAGHEVYAGLIARALQSWAKGATPRLHVLKPAFVANNWERARLYPVQPAMLSAGWKLLDFPADWAANFRPWLPKIWAATRPGEKITFKFKGTAAGLYDVMGPNGGQALITLDGEALPPVPRFDWYCGLYRLALLVLADDLPDTVHTVTVEIDSKQPDRSPVVDRVKDQPGFDPQAFEGTNLWVGGVMVVGKLVK
jgi:lysophospholipase L1-like esterase